MDSILWYERKKNRFGSPVQVAAGTAKTHEKGGHLAVVDGCAILYANGNPDGQSHVGDATMSNIAELGGYSLMLFRATVRLARGTDTCYVVAQSVEDAVQQVRKAYDDLNVLYIESVERLTGTLFLSEAAIDAFKKESG